jgi:hypothetical protein
MDSTFPKTNKWGYIKKNNIDKFNDTWTTFFWTERKESLGIRAFGISQKSCSIKAWSWTNCVNVVGDGAGIRISSKHQWVNVLKFFVYNKANAYLF